MKNLWNNDRIQFARLITELQMADAFKPSILEKLKESMDLELNDIYELIDRAQVVFEKSVAEI